MQSLISFGVANLIELRHVFRLVLTVFGIFLWLENSRTFYLIAGLLNLTLFVCFSLKINLKSVNTSKTNYD